MIEWTETGLHITLLVVYLGWALYLLREGNQS